MSLHVLKLILHHMTYHVTGENNTTWPVKCGKGHFHCSFAKFTSSRYMGLFAFANSHLRLFYCTTIVKNYELSCWIMTFYISMVSQPWWKTFNRKKRNTLTRVSDDEEFKEMIVVLPRHLEDLLQDFRVKPVSYKTCWYSWSHCFC